MAARIARSTVGKRFLSQSLKEEWSGKAGLKARVPAFSAAQTTVLDNGITVSSTDDLGPVASVTVAVKAGSRFESAGTAGAARLLGALAFQDTQHRSALHITRETESLGATTAACAGREHVVYNVTSLRGDVHRAVDTLADAVAVPLLHPWELPAARARLAAAAGDSSCGAVSDAVFAAAFRAGLGHAAHSGDAALALLTQDALRSFHAARFTGANIAVAAAGIAHEDLVHAVKKTFAGAIPAGAGSGAGPQTKYYGGERYVDVAGAPSTTVVLAHAAAGLNNTTPAGVAAFEVLAQLLGTGAAAVSFGARHAALPQAAAAQYKAYSDAGLLSVGVTAAPGAAVAEAAKRASDALAQVLAGNFSEAALARAKNLAKLALLDSSRGARNGLAAVQGTTPEAAAAAIDAVDLAAAKKAAAAAAASKRTHVVYGNLWNAPYADSL